MKIPFADLLQKTKTRMTPAPPRPKAVAPMPTAKKSESEKLSKTVLPNVARAIGEESTEITSPSPNFRDATARPASAPAPVTIKTEIAHAPAPPKVAMAPAPAIPAPSLPPAVALALEPNIERAISLPLEDVIAQMPEGYLKPRESLDTSRHVLLKAAEVEKGMATGRPAISVAALFQQAPEIFMHTVLSSDGAMVALPFERVMNALSTLAVRSDQAAELAVPQVETPFLQVTKEDTERFGTPMRAMPAAAASEELPPVRIEPATAEAFAAAIPEATDTFVPPRPTASETAANSSPGEAVRIPFTPAAESAAAMGAEKFGTGEPAFPRVPASSGPPVSSSSPPIARIPFNFPAPSDEVLKHAQAPEREKKGRSQKELAASHVAPRSGGEDAGSQDEPVLTLPLRPILEHLPPMQLGGDFKAVKPDATVSFPMSLIAPQLASGKVVVEPNAFYAALPSKYRKFFLPNAVNAPVQLSLPDVLANLPSETLRIRDDQEVHTQDEVFETPFSAKAAEDAARLTGNAPPSASAGAPKGRRTAEVPKPEAPDLPSAPKFTAKEAVTKACALSGVEACSVIFADGLSIAGNIPASVNTDGLSAVAPTLLQKLEKHMLQTSLGPLLGMTVHGGKASLSFFSAGNICLTALHSGVELCAESRGELGRLTEELSLAYAETAHVDH